MPQIAATISRTRWGQRCALAAVFLILAGPTFAADGAAEAPAAAPTGEVSYHRDVLPILQANCHGCHQPAKASGALEMTSFKNLLASGESGTPSVVPGKPDESYFVEQITPADGEAAMPQGKKPLEESQIALIRRWIEQGAHDDTPPATAPPIDAAHPPVYSGPPVIASIDWSPDGTLLAVAGFHEVLLHKADGTGLVARLVGMSERIESVRFSPDGAKLAVTGGKPARVGEVQIWNVADRTLLHSIPVTHDSVFGASWSPDGKRLAFGCTDSSVRTIDTETGEQVLYQSAHDDWVLDTVFSVDGTHLASVGRDMAAKLIEVATERFIDNITSITPAALKGGIQSVDRHPLRDEILFGGADGIRAFIACTARRRDRSATTPIFCGSCRRCRAAFSAWTLRLTAAQLRPEAVSTVMAMCTSTAWSPHRRSRLKFKRSFISQRINTASKRRRSYRSITRQTSRRRARLR